jgi:hypothetical protein
MARTLLVLGLPALCFLSSCWEGTTRDVVATVLSLRGDAVYSADGTETFRSVTGETKLGRTSVLRISAAAEVDLALIPGTLARVLSESELKIKQLRLTKDGNETGEAMRERMAQVQLEQGKMIVLSEGAVNFAIETPHVAIAVLPSCLFHVDVDQRRTRLTCVRGRLRIRSQNARSVTLGAGAFQEWPSERDAMPTTEDPRAQKDIAATVAAARELQQADEAGRDRIPAK